MVAVIRRSEFFLPEWVRRAGCPSNADPARFYLDHGTDGSIDPGPGFDGAAYLAANTDVRHAGMNPLVHYEWYGRRGGRPLRPADRSGPPEIPGAEPIVLDGPPGSGVHRRVAVFAAFLADGTVSPALEYLLRGLKEVVDDIVFVSASGILPSEAGKLAGLVRHAECVPHCEYDFGSYRRGFEWASENGFLDSSRTDELVLCNDSCFGPVHPFEESFAKMADSDCDFWGMTQFELFGRRFVQSYFFCFRRRALDGPALSTFLASARGRLDRGEVVERFETRLSEKLAGEGLRFATLVPPSSKGRLGFSPVRRPVSLLERYRMPLVKRKALLGDSDEPVPELLNLLLRRNPELFFRIGHPDAFRLRGTPVGVAPAISVFVPVYNGADTLSRALDSILSQTLAPLEVLVLDDGSTDGSAAVAERYADRGVRLVRLPHQGVYAIRNEALRLVRGDWFFNLDADNWIEPDFLARAAARIPALDPRVAVLYPDMQRFGGSDLFESWPDYSPERLKESNFLDMNSVIRTSAAREIGFDPSFATGLGDYDFFLGLAERGFRAEPLRGSPLHYEVRDGSISGANRRLGRRRAIARRLVRKHRGFFSAREARRLVRHFALLDSRALQAGAVRDLAAGRRAAAAAKLLRAVRIRPSEILGILGSGLRKLARPRAK